MPAEASTARLGEPGVRPFLSTGGSRTEQLRTSHLSLKTITSEGNQGGRGKGGGETYIDQIRIPCKSLKGRNT